EKTSHEVEPVDGEIVKDQLLYFLEARADDPTVIPMQRAVDALQCADQAAVDGLPDIAEMWRPAPVLIDGQFDALLLCQFNQTLARIQVNHERLLAEHVFTGTQCGFD